MTQQAMTSQRPMPEITPMTEPFWSAARRRELVVQRCDGCGTLRFPPEVACYACGSRRAAWTPVSGRATLYSWTAAHPPLLPYFADRAPWPVALVQLAEGPRMFTNLAGIAVEEYAIGMELQAGFEDIDGETTLVVFRRA